MYTKLRKEERLYSIMNATSHSFLRLYNISGEFTLVCKHISSLSFDGWEVYKTVGRKTCKVLTKNVNVR